MNVHAQVTTVFGRLQIGAETQGKRFVLLPYDERSTDQGLTKSVDIPHDETELRQWVSGITTKSTRSETHKFQFTVRVEMDDTMRELKEGDERKLITWLTKNKIWVTEHKVLAEEYVQLCWFKNAHILLTRRDNCAAELKSRLGTDLPIQITPRTVDTTVRNKKLTCRTTVAEVEKSDAPAGRALLKQISPVRRTENEEVDEDYALQL